ncbi:hypothetical protein [Phage NC-G]|nr:hypothetical protein [Phage NC-G]
MRRTKNIKPIKVGADKMKLLQEFINAALASNK